MATLTFNEVLRVMRVSRGTLYKRLADGTLPAVRLGRQWRISEEALNDFLRGGGSGGGEKPEDQRQTA